MCFSFGFWFINNSCMLALPMLSISAFVSNSLFKLSVKVLESGLLMMCECSQPIKQTSIAEPNVNKTICCTVAKTEMVKV